VIRGYLGVRTEALDDPSATETEDRNRSGARIVAVLEDTPAERGGLQVGDVIVEFAAEPIISPQQLMFLIAEAPVGQPLSCLIRRGGESRAVEVILEEMPAIEGQKLAAEQRRWLGLEVASLMDGSARVQQLKEALDINKPDGVLIVDVEMRSPAAAAGIRPGDVVLSINGRDILDLSDYRQMRSQLMDRHEPVRLLVRTAGMENYVLVQPRERSFEQ
jgi:serine protease Do